jgi:hypothetical protein
MGEIEAIHSKLKQNDGNARSPIAIEIGRRIIRAKQ